MSDMNFRVSEDNDRRLGAYPGRDGVHFGFYASGEECPELLLYKKGTQEIAARIPFPESEAGDRYHAMKVRFPYTDYEYNFCEGGTVVTDPYARKICGRETFGARPEASPHALRAGFLKKSYNWHGDHLPAIAYEDCIMYHLHVRGFTMQANSGVRRKGTFAGIQEKIPYLKSLGINQLRLMPAYEFAEQVPMFSKQDTPPATQAAAVAQALAVPQRHEQYRMNFWGYGDGFYFAPKHSYASSEDPDVELKDLVRALHANGMELILEFAFSDETDIRTMVDCLYFWALEYHIDGFAVMARESAVAELAGLPLFGTRKLICGWFREDRKERNAREHSALLAESNDGFMNDCRRLLRGDEDSLGAFAFQTRSHPSGCGTIHYMTNHDGFTLLDLVSYDQKHNLDNGEQNRDGTDYNVSWNCGEEGPTKKRKIAELRMRQRKNAYAMLLFAQGTPMLLAGDEFGNSQSGNNNPYCHDSELSWTDWNAARKNKELTEFVQNAIAYRKSHRVLHQSSELKLSDYRSVGFPDLSFHGERAWYGDFEPMNRHLGCLYAGSYAGEEGFVYIGYNFSREEQKFALPILPKGQSWVKVMDTSLKESFLGDRAEVQPENARFFTAKARSVVILEGKEHESIETE